MVPAAYGYDRPHATAGGRVCVLDGDEERGGMDSLQANKVIAAVLVAGIGFFLTGLIADNLVQQTPLKQSVLKIAGVHAAATTTAAAKPEQLPPIAPLLAKADVQAGSKFVHTVCTACHSFNEGGKPIVGPNLYNVVGGPHVHEAGFNYSPALEKFKGQPWTFDALNHWLYDPSKYAPGTRMTFAGIPNAQTRADVIAYLRTLSPNPVPLPPVEAAKPAAAPAAAAAKPGASAAPTPQTQAPAATPAAGTKPAPATTPAPGSTPAPAATSTPATTPGPATKPATAATPAPGAAPKQ
jgi:cytochrome c